MFFSSLFIIHPPPPSFGFLQVNHDKVCLCESVCLCNSASVCVSVPLPLPLIYAGVYLSQGSGKLTTIFGIDCLIMILLESRERSVAGARRGWHSAARLPLARPDASSSGTEERTEICFWMQTVSMLCKGIIETLTYVLSKEKFYTSLMWYNIQ